MPKRNLHPTWHKAAKVFCDDTLILTTGSTKNTLNVNIWSGNHPFYVRSQKTIDAKGRIERFTRRYGLNLNVE